MKIRVFTAFSGYDSQMMALRRLEKTHAGKVSFDLVGWSEIDENAIAAHNAVFPEYADRNAGDISKVEWNDVSDFDLFTYSFPCFVKGTLVLTEKGYKPIELITGADSVLTHTNQWKSVVTPMHHLYDGQMIRFNAMPFDELTCTAEHPLYVRRRRRVGHFRKRVFDAPEWRPAKDVTTEHFIGYAVNTKSELPQWSGVIDNRWGHHRMSNRLSDMFGDGRFWYLMGRYLGDGWKKNSKTGSGVVICCSDRNRWSLLNCIEHLGFNATINEDKTVTKVIISSNELNAFVDRFGYKAYGKRVDGETLSLPNDMLKELIDGYMDSDGCRVGKYRKATSVSRELIYGIGQCVAKCYHRPFSIYRTAREPQAMIENRIVNQRDSYSIAWKMEKGVQDKAFYEDGYLWFPINGTSSEDVKGIDVYNMEVDGDNSYTANGAIVHNCQDVSNAGLQRGLSEGSGSRSSLLWECRKAIEVKRPSFLMLENVSALVSKKFMPDFQRWLDYLDTQGYKTWWQKLNAKDYGVPQNRVRVFAVSIHKDAKAKFPCLFPDGIKYEFPQGFELDRRLKDVLVTYHDGLTVDEKYYLKTERIVHLLKWNAETTTNHKWEATEGGGVAKTVLSGINRNDDNYIVEKKTTDGSCDGGNGRAASSIQGVRCGGHLSHGDNADRGGLDSEGARAKATGGKRLQSMLQKVTGGGCGLTPTTSESMTSLGQSRRESTPTQCISSARTDRVIELTDNGYNSERPISSEGVSRTIRYNGFRGGRS